MAVLARRHLVVIWWPPITCNAEPPCAASFTLGVMSGGRMKREPVLAWNSIDFAARVGGPPHPFRWSCWHRMFRPSQFYLFCSKSISFACINPRTTKRWQTHNSSWRVKNQLDVTCYFYFFFLDTQHVSGINMPLFRSLRLCCWTTTLAYFVLGLLQTKNEISQCGSSTT